MTFDKPHIRCCLCGEFIAYTYSSKHAETIVGKPSASLWRAFNSLRWAVFDELGASHQRAFDKQWPIARRVA